MTLTNFSPTSEPSFRIFDQTITLHSPTQHFRSAVAHMYQRFRLLAITDLQTYSTIPSRTHSLECVLEGISAFDVSRFVSAYAAQIRSHLLLHAAVLSHNNQGILIVAPSMHGKTTLTLELLRRGFDFLSDDVAALSLDDNLVHPFPRSLVIRAGSLKLAGFPALPDDTPTWLGKQIVDAETLRPDCMGKPVPIRHIFFLDDKNLPNSQWSEASPNGHGQQIGAGKSPVLSCGLLLSSLPPELRVAIERVSGLEKMEVGEVESQPYLTLYAEDRPAVLKQVERLCKDRDVDLLHMKYREPHRPSFDGPVSATPISQSSAVLQLLEQFLGGYHSAAFQEELGGNSVRLSMKLAGMIRNANCYRLQVGPLNELANLVSRTVSV